MPVTELVLILIIVLDTIGSFLLGAFLGRMLSWYPFGKTGFTGVEGMLGRRCVITKITKDRMEAEFDSQIWAARPVNPNESFTLGEKALIRDVDSLTLIIEKIK